MKKSHLQSWFFSHLYALLAILFGAVALLFPTITLKTLAIYFALSIILGGLALSWASVILQRRPGGWGLFLVEGIFAVFLGILILVNPGIAATLFVTLLGIWSIFIGLVFLVVFLRSESISVRRELLIAVSILFMLTGLVIIINPFESSRAIVVMIGIISLLYGIISLFRGHSISASQ